MTKIMIEYLQDVKLVLMGNKTDLEERRVVPVDSHRNFSNSNNMMPTYVSAKTGDTVYMIFRYSETMRN